jgi:hypothetical protein
MNYYFFLLVYCLFNITFESEAQSKYIKSGKVIDSQTFDAVDLVYVQSSATKSVAISDDKGEFQLSCAIADTLTFSRLGYTIKTVFVNASTEPLLILLSETQITLPVISVYGEFKPQGKERWSESIRIPKPYDNPTYKHGNEYTMQTFGPGYTIIGPISYFLKSEREKRKLKKIRAEDRKNKVYRMLVSDPETKAVLMSHFSISEEEYNKKLEQFYLTYPEAVYSESKVELMDLLFYFFSKK